MRTLPRPQRVARSWPLAQLAEVEAVAAKQLREEPESRQNSVSTYMSHRKVEMYGI